MSIECTACFVEVEVACLVKVVYDRADGSQVELNSWAGAVLVSIIAAGQLPRYGVREEPGLIVQRQSTPAGTDDPAAAAAAGWQENEYGWVCPVCAPGEAEEAGVEHGASADPFKAFPQQPVDPEVAAALEEVLG